MGSPKASVLEALQEERRHEQADDCASSFYLAAVGLAWSRGVAFDCEAAAMRGQRLLGLFGLLCLSITASLGLFDGTFARIEGAGCLFTGITFALAGFKDYDD